MPRRLLAVTLLLLTVVGFIGTSAPTLAAPSGIDWVVAGSFQDDLPASSTCGEWNNACTFTTMEDTNTDGVFRLYGDGLPAGAYEYKIVESGNWNNSFPANNVPFTADGTQTRWYFQPGPNNVADNKSRCIATVAGSLQSEIGGNDWEPANLRTMLWQEEANSDWYSYTATLPAGSYEYKVARNEAFDVSYPANNVPLNVAAAGDVTFRYNCATNEVRDSINNPNTGPSTGDNNINTDGLYHDSRGDAYRLPYGAVNYDQAVTVRFRTFANDVQTVRLRTYDLASGSERFYAMSTLTEQPNPDPDSYPYQWWEATIPAPESHTIIYYRFVAVDGTRTAYYEDNLALDGGAGEALPDSADRSWNIYYYEPGYDVPEWAKNAVIYQIFPERFRNGDDANDPTADPATNNGWFYPQERGHRFPIAPWNTIVPDPEPYDPQTNPDWYSTYSSTQYGGDLQGILDKLDYLESIGVTTVYLNPIFDSPSNHKYDGRDFQKIDPNFGDLALFNELADELHSRGMYLVLDMVPNHVSSDSPLFDRFGRYDNATYGAGACEDVNSPYRDWFFFVPPADPQNPKCAGGVDYRGWFGVETLPQINTAHPDVLAYWFEGFNGDPATLTYWMEQGADGYRVDVVPDVVGVNPTFFEDWRDTLEEAGYGPNDPRPAMSYSETWGEGDVRERVLGDEFDSTMNYRFRNALIGFLRDTTFRDGDFTIDPLSASQFESQLRTIQEDYPAPAFESAMNLTGSHDTNRPTRVLDHADDPADPSLCSVPDAVPDHTFEDGRARMRLLSVIQFTLPGAPTIYYGDEVGLVGFGSDPCRDDPYNRQPYPWADEAGYGTLPVWRQADNSLLAHYQALGPLRNSKTYLRTGSWDTLLVSDAQNVLAYGRKDSSGAAIVVVNRSGSSQTVTLNLEGYIPLGATLQRQLGDGSSTPATATFEVTLGANDFRIWTTAVGTDMSTPNAPTVTATEGEGEVTLNITGGFAGAAFKVYRSLVSGGGFELVAAEVGATYTDTNLNNGQRYYYHVTAENAAGLESVPSAELELIPHYNIDWANLQFPSAITHTISTLTPTVTIYGQIYIDGVTSQPGATDSVIAEVGYGADGSTPGATWTWFDTTFNTDAGNNDEYQGTLLPSAVGTYDYAYRYSTTGGRDWTYGDLDGIPYDPAQAGTLLVQPSADTQAPAAPANLSEVSRSASAIGIEWDAPADADVYYYRIYRDNTLLATIPATGTTYTDETVMVGTTYTYQVSAVDTSFNEGARSNSVTITAEQRQVALTFTVTIPAWTGIGDRDHTIYIAGNNAGVFGQQWNPNSTPMTRINATTWEYTATALEGTALEYKYTRGEWDKVEWWGTVVGLENRDLIVAYGATGDQPVNDSVLNWRDLLVVDYSPPEAFSAPFTEVEVIFNRPIQTDTVDFTDFSIVNSDGVTITGAWVQETIASPIVGDTHAPTVSQFTFTSDTTLDDINTYYVEIQPGMTGLGNDGTGLREVEYFWVGNQTTAIALTDLGTGTGGGILLPLALLGATFALGVGVVVWKRK
jgi:glycosidase